MRFYDTVHMLKNSLIHAYSSYLAEAQPVAQLQRIILSKDSGEVVSGHGNHLVTAKLPVPVFKLHPVTKTLPLFDL